MKRLATVPLTNWLPDPDQPRKVFDQKKLAELADSLRANKQQSPAIGYKHPSLADHIIGVDGHRRHAALPLAGIFTIDTIVLDARPDPAALLTVQLSLGATNEKLSYFELADGCQKLKALRPDLTQSDIAREIGVSAPKLSKCMSISEALIPSARPLVESGELPFSVAASIARVPAEAQEGLVKRVLDGLLKRESVEGEVARLLGKKKTVPKSVKLRVGSLVIEYVGEKVEGLLADAAALLEKVKRCSKPSDAIESLPVLMKR